MKFLYILKIIIITCFLLLFNLSPVFSSQKKMGYNSTLKLHLQYVSLKEKDDKIDKFCQFPSESEKKSYIHRFCSLDNETQKTTNMLDNICQFSNIEEKEKILLQYCSFRTFLSKEKIIENFCNLKSFIRKTSYIDYLKDIAKIGERMQKNVNYNVEEERLAKRKEALNPKNYHIQNEPHSEAAYALGVIYGFSDCGMHDSQQAIDYFQIAYDKPETNFMIAELYRYLKRPKTEQHIFDLYENASKLGIHEADYNLAIYIYNILKHKKKADILSSNFTVKNMLLYMQKAAKNNFYAQNDLAILLYYQNKIPINIIDYYLDKSAKHKFLPAIYNQTILLSSRACTKNNQLAMKKNMMILLEKKYLTIQQLKNIIPNTHCFHKIFEDIAI